MQKKIIILSCNGDSAAGRTTRLAAQELVLEGKAEWYLSQLTFSRDNDEADDKSQPFITVDGCDKKCLFHQQLERGNLSKYQLTLTDMGIEPIYTEDITRDDIDLAKEAIIAECTMVSNAGPALFSGCCCR
jgi:uncharacterized metal-binding protein